MKVLPWILKTDVATIIYMQQLVHIQKTETSNSFSTKNVYSVKEIAVIYPNIVVLLSANLFFKAIPSASVHCNGLKSCSSHAERGLPQ